MTEKTLEQAIEIKRVIDRLRNKKEELEETRNLTFSCRLLSVGESRKYEKVIY